MPQLQQGKLILFTTDQFGADKSGKVVRSCAAMVVHGGEEASLEVFYDGQGGTITNSILAITTEDDFEPNPASKPDKGIGTWRHV